jgi:multidrug resistance efflux pump
MQLSALILTVILTTGQAASAPAGVLEIDGCLLSLIDEAQVPAQEAGVLTDIKVREGMSVEKGQQLAQIDDIKAKLESRVGASKLAVAKEKAGDDIGVRYSVAAADVAKAEYDVNAEANRRVPGSVPMVELNRLLLKHKETVLAIDKSKLEMRVAGHEANVAQAEADAGQESVNRRQIRSPLDGVVVDLHRHVGEWVQPGDQVLHVVRMDQLWVEGFVSTTKFTRSELQGQPVKVEVLLARDQRATFDGTIVFAKPTTEAGGTFLIRAEINNQKERGHWLLSPGLNAKMSIQLK